VTDYVLNRNSNVLHRLPASESCNTDQIQHKLRWSGDDANEQVVAYQDRHELVSIKRCRRCFGG
jgi:hypothetical protein